MLNRALFSGVAASLIGSATAQTSATRTVPTQAQIIDQRSFNALATVLPATQLNGSSPSTVSRT
jgi:hypothetical protein